MWNSRGRKPETPRIVPGPGATVPPGGPSRQTLRRLERGESNSSLKKLMSEDVSEKISEPILDEKTKWQKRLANRVSKALPARGKELGIPLRVKGAFKRKVQKGLGAPPQPET